MMPSKEQQATELREFKENRNKILPVFLAQFFTGLLLTVVIFYGGYYYYDAIPVPESNDFGIKLLYMLRCSIFPFAVLIFFVIMQVGNKRGSTPAYNPLDGKEYYVQTEKNILANTMEQTVLAFFILLALTTYLEPTEMKLVPLYVFQYLVGRLLFIIGYKISPSYRSCGIMMNSGGSVFLLGLIAYLVYGRGLVSNIPTITASVTGLHVDGDKSEL